MVLWLSVAGIALAVLCWNVYRRFAASRIDALANGRRASSRIVSRAEFVDGSRHMQVALALTTTDLFYENSDMSASLDLRWVNDIEYDTALATGRAVESGRVLRLRCSSQVFEFVLPADDVARWYLMLPPRRRDASPAPAVVPELAITA